MSMSVSVSGCTASLLEVTVSVQVDASACQESNVKRRSVPSSASAVASERSVEAGRKGAVEHQVAVRMEKDEMVGRRVRRDSLGWYGICVCALCEELVPGVPEDAGEEPEVGVFDQRFVSAHVHSGLARNEGEEKMKEREISKMRFVKKKVWRVALALEDGDGEEKSVEGCVRRSMVVVPWRKCVSQFVPVESRMSFEEIVNCGYH